MNIKKSVARIAFCISLLGLFSTGSHAEMHSPNLGLLGGATIGNSSTYFTFGAEGQTRLMGPYGAGASLTYYTNGISGTTYNEGFMTLTGQGLYFFSDILDGLKVGAQAGLGFYSTNFPGVSGNTSFIFGPTGGYDYKLSPNFSVGGEGTLYFSTRSGSSAFLQLLGAIKYWF